MSDDTKVLARTGYIHLAFSVGSKEQVDELTAKLKADGYEVVSGPRTTGDGSYESCIIGIELNDAPFSPYRSTGDAKKDELRGQRAVEIEDFSRIPEVVSTPETIEDGITIVGVVASGSIDLYTQTMYISKKNRSLATATDEQAPVNTPETTRSTASSNIVSKDSKNASDIS